LVVTEPRAASPTSWEREPFTSGVSIPYKAVFSEKQFARLKIGLVPKRMEDKWFIYYEEPHLFLHRSWTGQPVYCLALRKTPDGAEIDEALWSKVLAEAPDRIPATKFNSLTSCFPTCCSANQNLFLFRKQSWSPRLGSFNIT
jgi:hypothetical protein